MANEQNLIPLNKRPPEEARAIRSKGGSTKSSQRDLARLIAKSKKAKCHRCKARCPLKKSNLKEDKDMTCPISEARGYAIFMDKPVMNKDILVKMTHESLAVMQKKAREPRDLKLLHDMIHDNLKYEYPNVVENLNVNVNAECSLVEAYKEVMKEKKVEEEKEDEEKTDIR
jgi:hypothetical protein